MGGAHPLPGSRLAIAMPLRNSPACAALPHLQQRLQRWEVAIRDQLLRLLQQRLGPAHTERGQG